MISDKALNHYKKQLSSIFNYPFTLYPNGIFNAIDVDSDNKDKLLNKLKSLEFVRESSAAFYRNDNGESLYQIYGIIDIENLDEAIKINDKLNPKLWLDNNELIPEVEDKIKEIANDFIESLREDEIEISPVDVYIVGSNANFNYTDESDLDLHIIADQSFDCQKNHLTTIYNLYRSLYNRKYDLSINGVNVELYVENASDFNNVTSGIYSLNNGWIKKPVREDIPEIDDMKLDKSVAEWEDKYLNIKRNPNLEAIEQYIVDIYELRKEGLKNNSEFSLGNLIFKEIRRLGYLDNLKDLRDEIKSKQLSL